MRRQITEARLLSRFKKLFGDCEQRKHRKYKEPVKGKGFRTLFRKAGYGVYLVDEFRTSCRCSACGGECKIRVMREPATVSNRQCPATGPREFAKLARGIWNRDTECRVQHLEDCRARDSRRSATGLPHTSQSLTQWCYVGNHPNHDLMLPHQTEKF